MRRPTGETKYKPKALFGTEAGAQRIGEVLKRKPAADGRCEEANGPPHDGTKCKSQAPSAPTSPHDGTKCKSKAPSVHSQGPNQSGGIKTENRRPKAAVRRPNGSPHGGTKYKSKAPFGTQARAQIIGEVLKKREPAAEGRCERTEQAHTLQPKTCPGPPYTKPGAKPNWECWTRSRQTGVRTAKEPHTIHPQKSVAAWAQDQGPSQMEGH